MKPSRPSKVPQPPLPEPEAPAVVEEPEFRYARRTSLVAKPTLGNPVIVTKVGLGHLTVQTAHGTDSNN